MQRVTARRDRSRTYSHASERPAFLVGAPRSGTTLLYKILCMHPEAAWISNWVRSSPRATALAAFNRIPAWLPTLQRRAWFAGGSNAYVYGKRRATWERVFPMPVEGEPIFERVGITDPGPNDAPRQALVEEGLGVLRSRLEAIRRFSGGSVFINKRIGNNRRIGMLTRGFPSARFVDLVRDGRAVAYSLSSVDWWPGSVPWWHDRTPERSEAEGCNPWELCARSWVEEVGAIEQGLQDVPPEQVFHLSYEQLVGSPVASVRSVATFVGLPESHDWLERVSQLRFPNRNERWRQQLGPADITAIEQIQGERLRKYGYV